MLAVTEDSPETSGPKADAIVVLGAAVWEGARPSPSLRRRVAHAAGLFQSGAAPLIIGSGGLGRFPPSEADMIGRLLAEAGVPGDAFLAEDRSRTTLENVLFSARLMRERGLSRVLVVSDRYHLPRAVMCFRALGFDAAGSGPGRGTSGTPLRKWIYYHLREIAALPWYALKLGQLRSDFRDTARQPV